MKTYLFFDTETNGLPADYTAPATNTGNWPQILQLAWVLAKEDGQEVARRNDLIRPADGVRLDAGAAAVHGLTLDRLAGGLPIAEALTQLRGALMSTDVLVAHNISFDLAIVQAEFHRAGESSTANIMGEFEQICTMRKSTYFCAIPARRGYKWPNLGQLHRKLFNEGFDGAHDAMNDVEALMRCFWALKEKGVVEKATA